MAMPTLEEEAIFHAARRIETADGRRRYLDDCCDDADLRARVEALLRVHDLELSFLQTPADGPTLVADVRTVSEGPGAVIGPYRLVEQIGEGGFGIVFAAGQEHPVRRTVALKVIKPGMDSAQVIARFEAERQALALMDHPNIAKVLDAGTVEAHGPLSVGVGRPYFVMELVHGLPITSYCDRHRLTPRERLILFVPVCQAVQHAHQKGVIHRDLKPSNVLVSTYDDKPMPKVIDFGVAKATGPRLTERTLSTGLGAVVGTLEYMSPEQAEPSQQDVDTRSDIYSLGVLLYELLTGTTPLDKSRLKQAALLEVLRVIREEEPPRPSTRLSTAEGLPGIAADRGLESRKLSGVVRGELDWIVMKCLEKDRTRRYETADGLARDLERYLADEPVEACPPTAGYRLRKFARKNRKLLGTLAAFGALVLAGGGVTAVQAVRLARAEREEAGRVAARAQEQAARGRQVHDALDRARELREQARTTPGQWDKWAEAQAMARRAEALVGDGATDAELAGQVHGLLSELAEEAADRRLVARLEEIRLLQADVHVEENRFLLERAIPEYRDAFREYGLSASVTEPATAAAWLRGRPPAVRGILVAALDHWLALARADKAPEAGWLDRVLAAADSDSWRQRLRAARATKDREALEQLAKEVDASAQPPQALFLLERALHACGARGDSLDVLRRAQQAFPGDFWTNQNLGMGLALCQPPQLDEAIRYLTAAVALRPESPGARLNLGLALRDRGRLDEAAIAVVKATELKPNYAEAHYGVGLVHWKAGRPDKAVPAFRRAVELKPTFAEAHANLGGALAESGRADQAVAVCRRAIELKPGLAQSHYLLGNALKALGKLDDAIAAYRRAIDLKRDHAEAHCNLGVALDLAGRVSEAIAAFRKATKVGPALFQAHFNLGVTLNMVGRAEEAVPALRRAAELKPDDAAPHYNLGNVFLGMDRFDDATAAYRRAIELAPGHAEAHCNLADALRWKGKFAEARDTMSRGHDLGSRRPDWRYPSGRWVDEYRRLVELDGRLPAVLRGDAKPGDAAERNMFAQICHYKGLYAAAARLRAEAFAADPDLAEALTTGHRYDGACAAAMAAAGRGGDAERLRDGERARWRKQALEWLRADLTANGKVLAGGTRDDGHTVQQRLRSWLRAPALEGLREPAALAGLPADEREGWKQLWADVRDLLNRAGAAE